MVKPIFSTAIVCLFSLKVNAQQFYFSKKNYNDSTTLAAAIPVLSKEVMTAYQENNKANYYDNIQRYAIVAKQYSLTLSYLDSLRAIIKNSDPLVISGVGFQFEIYARTQMQQQIKKSSFEKTFEQIFTEHYNKLTDNAKVVVNSIASTKLKPLQETLYAFINGYKTNDSISLNDARILVRTYNSYIAYSRILPIMKRILQKENNGDDANEKVFNQLSLQQIKYLYDAGRLWGNVKYFHPYLAYRNINWDSSFAAAVPKILACRSAKEYATILQNILSVLHDAATSASFNNNKTDTILHFTNTERGKAYLQDSILIMRLNDKAIADDYNETVKITSQTSSLLDSAKAVVFDLRQTKEDNRLANPSELNYEFSTGDNNYQSLNKKLCSSFQILPSERFVVQEGFKGEATAYASDTYQPYFKIKYATVINGIRILPLRIVFLLNKNVAAPKIAITLQKQGLATILSEDGNTESHAISTLHYAIDSVNIYLRESELADKDGLMPVQEDSLLAPQTDYNINLQTAISVASKPINKKIQAALTPSNYTGSWKPDIFSVSHYPRLGYRVLAAAKMYSVIHFFNPDKDLFDNNWDSVFMKYLPQYVTAKDDIQYMQAVAGMYSNMQDSHGFSWSVIQYAWDSLFGSTRASACVRVTRVENKPVVSLIFNDSVAKKEGFEKGDVIVSINGRNPDDIVNEAAQYISTSNEATKFRDIDEMLLSGDNNTAADVVVQKANGIQKHIITWHSFDFYGDLPYEPYYKNELPVCKIFSDSIGYVDLAQLTVDNVDSIMTVLRNTKAIIFDDRTYPPAAAQQVLNYLPLPVYKESGLSGPVVDADVIDNDYADRNFTTATTWFYKEKPQTKNHKWTYKGKTVVLINEWTQSQAEATAGDLIACGANSIGTHTAGANGDITNFNLPGNINLTFSGHRAPMQRIGIQPDIKAEPTIKGVREGRDDVLEKAIGYLQSGK